MIRKKIIPYRKAASCAAALRKKRKRIVFTNGCFDILHCGHTSYLNKAKQCGDILFVGVNSDASVRLIKGNHRPINSLKNRMEILANLECIDYLCAFNQTTPLQLIKRVQPRVLVKGADYKTKEIVGAEFVKSYGGTIRRLRLKKGHSTSTLIKKLSRCKK